MLVVLSVIWGSFFLFGRIAVTEVPPLTLALARVALAAATLNLLLAFITVTPGKAKRWSRATSSTAS